MQEYPIRLHDALMHPQDNPDGWLYLPRTKWDLETQGIFAVVGDDPSPDYNDDIPAKAKEEDWVEALDNDLIEEVIGNLQYRYPNPTAEQRLEAFIFYWENDAFIVT